MSFPKNTLFFICTGEASGDLLGGNLAKAILEIDSQIELTGVGGKHMREAGVSLIEDLSKMGIFGAFELIKHLKDIYTMACTVKNYLKQHRPDLVILIDYAGFNLHIAKAAKKLGLKVLFYVSPQIWASRYGRIKRIRRYVDHMAVLYDFEAAIYKRENIPVTCVGHPLIDIAKPTHDKTTNYQRFNFDPQKPIVALFPGSRQQEITRLLPIILEAKKLIQKAVPHVQFALPIAPTLDKEQLLKQLPSDITVVENDTYNLLTISTVAIAASGTATLEIGLFGIPLVILYKLATPSYWLIKSISKTRIIGLCNIIAQTVVAKEYLQKQATGENIAREIIKILLDVRYRQTIIKQLERLKYSLGPGDSSKKVAALAFQLLTQTVSKSKKI